MAIGERIKFMRNLRGMTQKYLGMSIGFDDKTADVRIAQYESGTRTPKADITMSLSRVLDVAPSALDIPDIDSFIGLMHTLFTLEDNYGLNVCNCDGEVYLRVDVLKGKNAARLHEMLCDWRQVAAMMKAGEITKKEYDRWRYHYPELDPSGQWYKATPALELSNSIKED